jgi:hypothetical protein
MTTKTVGTRLQYNLSTELVLVVVYYSTSECTSTGKGVDK